MKITMNKIAYCAIHLIMCILAFMCFIIVFFRGVDINKWFVVSVSAVMAVGVVRSMDKRRTFLSMFENILIPLGISSIVFGFVPLWIVFLGVPSAITMAFGLYVRKQNENVRHPRSVLRRKIIKVVIVRAKTIYSFAFAVMLVVSSISVFSLRANPFNEEAHTQAENVRLDDNMNVVSRFDPQIWVCISEQQKYEALQTIANIEATYFGLPYRPTVVIKKLPENHLGEYTDRTIIINSNIVMSTEEGAARTALTVILHETFHAYQIELARLYNNVNPYQKDLLIFYNISTIASEFENYIDGDDDPVGYYNLNCEIDARAYSEAALSVYIDKIDAFLDKAGS